MTESVAPSPRPRDWRFDLIRVCACFGIVVLHTTGRFQFEPERSAIGALGVVVNCLARPALPLFRRRRLKRVWLPTLFWSAVYLVLYLAERFASGRQVDAGRVLDDWLWNGKPGAGYHLWFLYALLALELVGPWIMLARKKAPRRVDAALFALWLAFCARTALSIAINGDDGRDAIFFGVLAVGSLPQDCWGAFSGVWIKRLPTNARRRVGNGAIFIAGDGLGALNAAT